MTARWDDEGEPANLEAAAEDAYKWLTYLQELDDRTAHLLHPDDREQLNNCLAALKKRLGRVK